MKIRFMTTILALILLTSSVAVFSSCTSRNTAKLEFSVKDAKIEYSEAVGVYYATVTVVTTCVSGRLYEKEYPHNVEGGKPWLMDGDVAREGRAEINGVVTELNMRKGDTVEYTWTFDIPGSFSEGDYDVHVEWFGTEQVFEGVTFTKAE